MNLCLCSSCTKDIEPVLYSITVVIKDQMTYRCTALFRYEKTLKKIIGLFKFSRELKQAKACAGLILENLNLAFNPDIIVPVPSHPIEEIKRGFSHMNYLAGIISQRIEIPYYPVIGRKVFPLTSRSQKAKGKKQRFSDRKRFYIRKDSPDIVGKKILLIDDVMTTGVTMNDCADILMEHGAAKVHGISLGLTPF
ncbi:MAG: phosphoribosyltransferase family protein [bacterium]